MMKFADILRLIEGVASTNPAIQSDGFYSEETLEKIENSEDDSEFGNEYAWMDLVWPTEPNQDHPDEESENPV